MTDTARLAVEVDSKGVRTARGELKELGVTGGATAREVKTATGSMRHSFASIRSSIVAAQSALVAFGAVSAFQKVLSATGDFEQALIGVGKTTNTTGTALDDLGEQIKGISERVPVATTDLLSLAQAAGQLGVHGPKNIAKFTETIAKLGISTDLVGEQAATTFARILTVTGTPISEVDRLGASIVALGNNYAATESEIASVATRVGQSTSQFGVSADQVLGIGTALRAIGINAEAGGTQVGLAFQQINNALRDGGQQMQTLQAITGKTGDALREDFFNGRSTRVFNELVQGLGDIQKRGGDVKSALDALGLKGVRATQVLGTLATRSGVLEKALRDASRAYEQNTALNQEAATATDTFNNKMELLGNAFSNLLSSGNIDELMASVSDLTDAINDPDFKAGIQTIVQGMLDATTYTANLITQIASLKDTLSKPFDLSDTLKFIFDRSGPGFIYNNFIKDDNSNHGASGSFRNGATGSYGGPREMAPITVSGSASRVGPDSPISMQSLSGVNIPDTPKTKTMPQWQAPDLSQYLHDLGQTSTAQAKQNQLIQQQNSELQKSYRIGQGIQQQLSDRVHNTVSNLRTPQAKAMSTYDQQINDLISAQEGGLINQQQYIQKAGLAWKQYKATADSALTDTSEFARRAASNIQDTLGNILQQTLEGHFDGILSSWVSTLQEMASQAAAAGIGDALLGKGFGKTDDIGGLLGKGLDAFTGQTEGGFLSDARSLLGKVPFFADGGISDKPSIFGESGPEAAVPLPDGRRIPVDLRGQSNSGGSSSPTFNVTYNEAPGKSADERDNDRGQFMAELKQIAKQATEQHIGEMVGDGSFDKFMSPYTTQRAGHI